MEFLYPALNGNAGLVALGRWQGRYSHLGETVSDILRNALFRPGEFLSALDLANILFYLFLLSLPLAFYWRRSSLPLLAATLPLLAVNSLSSASAQQDLLHQYSLPIAALLVVASMDGLAADLCQGRLWLTRRLWLCCFWATLCFVVLVKRGYTLGYHLVSTFDEVQPVYNMTRLLPADDRAKHDHVPSLNELSQAQSLIRHIPADAAVLTHNNLAPHISHRPVVKQLGLDATPRSDFAEFNVAFLDRKNPWYGSSHSEAAPQHTAATIEQLKIWAGLVTRGVNLCFAGSPHHDLCPSWPRCRSATKPFSARGAVGLDHDRWPGVSRLWAALPHLPQPSPRDSSWLVRSGTPPVLWALVVGTLGTGLLSCPMPSIPPCLSPWLP